MKINQLNGKWTKLLNSSCEVRECVCKTDYDHFNALRDCSLCILHDFSSNDEKELVIRIYAEAVLEVLARIPRDAT